MTWANRSRSLFCYEQPEQIAHSRSFVQSNLSKLLTVALLFRATWGICSRSLFKKEKATERRATGAIWFLSLKLQKPLEKMIFFNFFLRESLVFESGKSDLSESLTVVLSWGTWANHKSRMSERANFQPWVMCVKNSF